MHIFAAWGHFYQGFSRGCTTYLRTTPDSGFNKWVAGKDENSTSKKRIPPPTIFSVHQKRQTLALLAKKNKKVKSNSNNLVLKDNLEKKKKELLELCGQITSSHMELIAMAGYEKGFQDVRNLIDVLFPGRFSMEGDCVPNQIAEIFVSFLYEGDTFKFSSPERKEESKTKRRKFLDCFLETYEKIKIFSFNMNEPDLRERYRNQKDFFYEQEQILNRELNIVLRETQIYVNSKKAEEERKIEENRLKERLYYEKLYNFLDGVEIAIPMRNALIDAFFELTRGEWYAVKDFKNKVKELCKDFTFKGSSLSSYDTLFSLLSIRKTLELKEEDQEKYFRLVK